jgi:5-methylcytosine-specific restriction enzyme subunit McrC
VPASLSAELIRVSLAEHETVPIDVDQELAEELQRSPLLTGVFRRPGAGTYSASASSIVGIDAGTDWELRVFPKFPVRNLLHLLGFSTDDGWGDTAALGDIADFVDAIAQAFLRHAERATMKGLLHGYKWVDADLTSPRGRIDFARQAQSRRGLPVPLAVRFEEYSPDIDENRILKVAGSSLRSLRRLPSSTRNGIDHLTARMADVGDLRGRPSSAPAPTRLNLHYAPALQLAMIILNAMSTHHRDGNAPNATFAFDMNRVFEEYVGQGLARRLEAISGRVRFRSATSAVRRVAFDDDGVLMMEPDVTWTSSGRPIAVVDAKYKDAPAPGDFYQALAYASALGLPDVHLVLPEPSAVRMDTETLQVRNRRIHVHRVALGAGASEMEAGLDRLATGVARSASALP